MNPIRRRLLESTLALPAFAAFTPRLALAQARQVRIGALGPRPTSLYLPAVLRRLGELGYVEGKNMVIEFRSADGAVERFPSLARELIRAKCDLIIALGVEPAARALLEAGTGVPIVILAVDYDPLKSGIVFNLHRPGGNVTGMVLPQLLLAAKRMELLYEIVPRAKRFLVLSDAYSGQQLEAVREAAQKLRVEIVAETFAALPYDLESAFAKAHAARVEAVNVLVSPVLFELRGRIAEQLLKYRLPAVASGTLWFDDKAGFLIGYSAKELSAFTRAGDIVASILKGAKPGEIPIEQSTEFEFVVNLKTAKALAIPIPPSIMLRADRVIE